jgi:hypothetical protein
MPLADDTVEVGQTFFAQIVAREHHPGFSGLHAVFLDIAWDADVLDVVEPFDPKMAVTPNLPLFAGGQLHQEESRSLPFLLDNRIRDNVGHIDGLGGMASVSSRVGKPIGSDGDDRYVKTGFLGLSTTDDHFAWLHFRADQAGTALLTMRQGGWSIVTLPTSTLSSKQLHFESQIVTVVEPAAPMQEFQPDAVPVDLPASDVPVALNEPSSVTVVTATPDSEVTIADDAGTPAQVESVFQLTREESIWTLPPITSVIVEPPAIADPIPASDEPIPGPQEPPTSAVPVWHNADYPLDVDGTGRVAPVDVVIIVNYLNISPGRWELPAVQTTPPRYLDVNGDGGCTPHDAVLVINYIDRRTVPAGEGEFSPPSMIASDEVASDAILPLAAAANYQPMVVLPLPDRRGRDSTAVSLVHPAQRVGTAVRETLHMAASLRDGETGFGETGPRGLGTGLGETGPRGAAAADEVFRTRRIATEIWTDLEDILQDVAAGWFRAV